MNFSQRQRDPRKHLAGITFVILFHAFIVYALVTGLAKKVVDVVRAPIETKVIEEIKKPPPPPEIVVPPPPKLEAPPPPFIPPPEIQIATPPPQQPTITAVTPTPPPAPVVIAPAPPPPVVVAEVPPPPPAPKPKTNDVSVYCTKQVKPEVPGTSYSGRVVVSMRVYLTAGKVSKTEVMPGSFQGISDRRIQRAFTNSVLEALEGYTCAGDNVYFEQTFEFKVN